MTKEQILAMKPGEELDNLVACEVMEEAMPESAPGDALRCQLAGSPIVSSGGNWLYLCRWSEGDIPTWRPRMYSMDISMAWRVWEKTTFDVIERHYEPNGIEFCYQVGYEVGYGGEICYSKTIVRRDCESPFCGTFQEAVCKSALLSMLEKK